jgi:hypothetical protein
VVRKIYEFYGIQADQSRYDAMQRHVDAERSKPRVRHSYEVGPREVVAAEREIYKRYQDYFGVPSES